MTSAIAGLPEFRQLKSAVDAKALPAVVTGLSGIHKANIIYSLCVLTKRRAFVVASDEAEAQRLQRDLSAMGMHPAVYPARDFSFRETAAASHEYEHERLHVLAGLLSGRCDCVIACIDAALQYTVPPSFLRGAYGSPAHRPRKSRRRRLPRCCSPVDMNAQSRSKGPGNLLTGAGFSIFPAGRDAPVRIEFWGMKSIRSLTLTQKANGVPIRSRRSPSCPPLRHRSRIPTALPERSGRTPLPSEEKRRPLQKAVLMDEAALLTSGVRLGNADKFISCFTRRPQRFSITVPIF